MAQPRVRSDRESDGRWRSPGGQAVAATSDMGAEARAAARPWVERAARMGYLAKGIVYLLVGGIAASAAFGGDHVEGSRGALGRLVEHPLGKVVLGLVALGLAGYALWQAIRAVLDPEHRGTDGEGIGKRAYAVGSAIIHGGLALAAARLLLGDRSAAEDTTRSSTADLMAQPAGRWLVALAGLIVLGVAIQQFATALGGRWRKHIHIERLDPAVARWLGPVARAGLGARGVVFLIIGGFLVLAALRARPEEAKGVGDALATLATQPFGTALLLIVALGLCAYGLYEVIKARYREIVTP
jgi:hypothetical protein